MRQTSRDAYRDLKDSGKQQTQCDLILNFIADGGKDYTLQELKTLMGLEINVVSGRVNDLKKSGKLSEFDKRKCRITDRLVTPVGITENQTELFK